MKLEFKWSVKGIGYNSSHFKRNGGGKEMQGRKRREGGGEKIKEEKETQYVGGQGRFTNKWRKNTEMK